MLRTLALGAFFAFSPFVAPPEAYASCAARAAQVASSTGGRVVSVRARGNSCVVRVVTQSGGGRPRSRQVVVPK